MSSPLPATPDADAWESEAHKFDVREADYAPQVPPRLTGYTLAALAGIQFPSRKALLCRGESPIFRAGDLAELVAYRGFGKTWFLQTLALLMACRTEALGLRAPEPCRVLHIDGEMAREELQERYQKLCDMLGLSWAAVDNLTIVAADWQDTYLPRLDTPEGREALEPFFEQADAVILDNRSCLFDSEGEKDPTAWAPAQELLLSLRRRGKAVMMGHHANRQGGARGIGKAEDPLNLILKLSRPEGYRQEDGARFTVEFEKARGIHGQAAAPFVASLTPHGWVLDGEVPAASTTIEGKLLDYLRAACAMGEAPKTGNTWISGAKVGRTAGLTAIRSLLDSGSVHRRTDGAFYVA